MIFLPRRRAETPIIRVRLASVAVSPRGARAPIRITASFGTHAPRVPAPGSGRPFPARPVPQVQAVTAIKIPFRLLGLRCSRTTASLRSRATLANGPPGRARVHHCRARPHGPRTAQPAPESDRPATRCCAAGPAAPSRSPPRMPAAPGHSAGSSEWCKRPLESAAERTPP